MSNLVLHIIRGSPKYPILCRVGTEKGNFSQHKKVLYSGVIYLPAQTATWKNCFLGAKYWKRLQWIPIFEDTMENI